MLALEHVDRARIVPDQAAWFPTIFEGISTERGRALGARDEPRDQRIFAALAGDELSTHGYEVGAGGAPAVSPRQERWFHRQNELMRNVNFIRLRLVQERGRELRFALARARSGDPARGVSRARGRRGRSRPSRPAAPPVSAR